MGDQKCDSSPELRSLRMAPSKVEWKLDGLAMLLHLRIDIEVLTSSGVSMRSLSQLQRSLSGMCMYCRQPSTASVPASF